MKKRIKQLQSRLGRENLDAIIVTDLEHIRYMCGFSCTELLDGLLVVLKTSAHLFTDFRYTEQAAAEVSGAKVHIVRKKIEEICGFKPLQKTHFKIAFESTNLPFEYVGKFRDTLTSAVFLPASGYVEELALVKDNDEIGCIKEAAKIADVAFERILGVIEPGVTENEVAAELEYQMKIQGSEKPAFETIVASGWRAALPHGLASDKKIKKGEMITFDFGAVYKGYACDITRTVFVGPTSSKQKKVYNLVLKAQKKALSMAKAGITGEKLDSYARSIIARGGYEKQFGHGLGHGVGMKVHEGPRVAPQSDYVLKAGNVVTIEPGIYIPKWGGVRIEDDIVIRRNGCSVLNKAPKELIEL
jgi:Xaa-Pro aminopeptidase